MELVERRRGVQRLGNEDIHMNEDDATCINQNGNRVELKDGDNDRDTMSDCESETSEVLSVGSEPTPANEDLGVEEKDDHNGSEHYESDAESKLSAKVVDSSRELEETPTNGKSIFRGSSPSSRSPSPSLSSSASCDPPQSPASNYCTTSPQNRASPSSPAASSVRSPASSSATASSPSRPDAHQEAIVPRFQSASISGNIHHHNLGSIVQNHQNNNHQHHHHLLSNNRYAAAALVTTCRDSNDLAEYSSVVGGSTVPRIPVHHPISLTAVSHGTSAVADLIGYTQQSIDLGRSIHSRVPPTLNVPLITRLSLSPPTAMTVTGLQANAPSTAFHPVAVAAAAAAAASCRDPRETNPLLIGHPAHLQHSGHGITAVQHPLLQQQSSAGASQIQHVPPSATVLHNHHHHHQQQHHHHHHHHHGTQNSRRNPVGNQSSGQHRLSVSKLLQQNDQDSSSVREAGSPRSPEPRGADDHHRQSHRHSDGPRSNSSSGNNGLQSSPGVPTSNNDRHRSNSSNSTSNNNNNMQHQTSLKFSIDNILKADFGRRITDPISLKKSRSKKVVPRPIDLTKDFRETSSESSERGSETSTTTLSPGATSTINTSCTSASNNVTSGVTTTGSASTTGGTTDAAKQMLWPAWVYCTRYSDRPSSGRSPRTRRVKRTSDSRSTGTTPEEKRPRTAFSGEQLARLKREFGENRYLTERRRQQLSRDLGLNEAQIKIWFQNKRAKIKKASGQKNPLALQLMAQGLYNHSTVPLTKEEEEQAAELQAK